MQTREKTKETKINKEEKDKMRNKKGISLIVLVITIIVMIILAAAVIISLSNSGIINRANQAVNSTNLAEVQHLASLAWSEAYLDAMADKTLTEEQRDASIKAAVEKVFTDNNLNTADYDLTYGAGGVTVATKGETVTAKWKVERTTNADGLVTEVVVTNGTDTYDVGTVVNYMPEGVGPTNYKGGWKILGADEDGRLLIMSTESITGSTLMLGSHTSLEEAKTSHINALYTLQNTVKDYVDGTIGVSVRSITVEDINTVTGFDPETYTTTFMGVSGVKAYGKEVSYSWNSTGVGYSWENGSETKTGDLSIVHDNGFTYYDEATNTFTTSTKATSGDITTLKNTYYYYTGNTALDNTTEAYKMLFGNGDAYYWLASNCVALLTDLDYFGVRFVNLGNVHGYVLVHSDGAYDGGSLEVRAVVTLSSDVSLTESTTAVGTYDLSK